MEELGLTRVPYYSELSVFNRDDVPNDAVCLVLSVMLYWHSLEKCQRFNARNHVHLLARNLRRTPECVKECLDYLTSLKILDKKEETITTESDNLSYMAHTCKCEHNKYSHKFSQRRPNQNHGTKTKPQRQTLIPLYP